MSSRPLLLRQAQHARLTCSSGTHSLRHRWRLHPQRAALVDDTREPALDRTLSETFPCSDPLSSIPNPQL